MGAVQADPREGDAFGHYLLDALAGRATALAYERDDGYLDVDRSDYLADWSARDQWALDRLSGHVVDVGAGAGRASLVLQQRDQPVLALDTSPGAIEVCRRRGVRQTFHGCLEDLAGQTDQRFDRFLFLGNTLGLMGAPDRVAGFFGTLESLSRPGAMVVGGGLDPYPTGVPEHLAYHEYNRRQGRLAGQVRLRTRYRAWATGWFDVLWLSVPELTGLAGSAGWRVTDVLPGPLYAAALTRG
jgi:SAM-dependent methyltransferase